MLETERSRLSEVIEAMPIGVGIVDASGRVVLGNAVMQRLNSPMIQSPMAQSILVAPRGEWIAYGPDGNRLRPEDRL
jgi:hypothetical protein